MVPLTPTQPKGELYIEIHRSHAISFSYTGKWMDQGGGSLAKVIHCMFSTDSGAQQILPEHLGRARHCSGPHPGEAHLCSRGDDGQYTNGKHT